VCGPGNQGRRAPLRFALAPGCHIPRRWRSELVPLYYSSPVDQYYLRHSQSGKYVPHKKGALAHAQEFQSCYLANVDPPRGGPTRCQSASARVASPFL